MSLSSSVLATPFDRPRAYVPARPADSANSSPVDRTRTTIDDAEEQERAFSVLRALQLGQLEPSQLKLDVVAAKPTSSSKERLPNLSPSSPVYEQLYLRIGRWVGPFANPDAKRALFLEWSRYGNDGTFWLVGQIRHERNLDAFDGIAEVLISMASLAAPYLIGALRVSADENNTELQLKYLRILEWFVPEDIAPWAANFERILEVESGSPSTELREAAYRCISLLPQPAAFLGHALAAEPDPDLRCLLEEQQGRLS